MIKINYDLEMQKILEKLKDEERKPKLLLHSCCAPCSSTVIELLKEYFDITIYYYNPNITENEEYHKRYDEMTEYVKKREYNISVLEGRYNPKEDFFEKVKGLENVKIIRNAYAIEYDCINPNQLKLSLEFRNIQGLFSGGQFNGSSGYEEAACQGLIAGINAARKCLGKDPVILDRSQAYIGVLIDDLVTKETQEPYRMMTSRAEYRLLLRQDNADLRLTDIGHEIGLIDEARYEKFCEKRRQIDAEIARMNEMSVGANKHVQDFLTKHGSSSLGTAATLAELIRRPELSYEALEELDTGRQEAYRVLLGVDTTDKITLDNEVVEQINIAIKYDGYISRQKQQVEHFQKMEKKQIPDDINYDDVANLRKEARQKLSNIRPTSLGQASRISGVSPADVSVLMIYLETKKQA